MKDADHDGAHGGAALAEHIGRLWQEERQLAHAFLSVANRHERDAGTRDTCMRLAEWSEKKQSVLAPFAERYGRKRSQDAEHVRGALFHGPRWAGAGLLRDAQDLALLAEDVKLGWTALQEAAPELHDAQLEDAAKEAELTTRRQIEWLESKIKLTAPSALTVTPDPIAKRAASRPKTPTPAAMPTSAWAPTSAAILTVVVASVAVASRSPVLVPSLGPTIWLAAEEPAHPASHPWNVVVGHLVGLAIGTACALATGVWNAAPVIAGGSFTLPHALAAAVAIALTLGLSLVLRASHPPAAATTLLVVLGGLHGRRELVAFAVGLVLVAVLGEIARRLRTDSARPHAS